MQFEWVKMQEDGRILLPAEIRKSIKASPGDKLCISVDDHGNVKLQSRINALREAQSYFAQFKNDGKSVVEEFIIEKGEEARRELAE
jgi:bifunctional DNA-binding transcriptional regulator/antitoxin component of YhaV-PrlF toxin-antitoxin module